MAQFALVAATTSAEGGAMALFTAAVVGAVVDSLWMPYVFRRGPLEGGRVEDFQPLGTSEGTPLVVAVGQRVKVPGRLAWADEVFEVAQSSSAGKHQTVVNYKYYMSCQIQFLNNEVDYVLRVYADTELVFDEETEAKSHTGTGLVIQPTDTVFRTTAWVHAAYPGAPDFNEWTVGEAYPLTISGASNSANNGAWAVIAKGNKDLNSRSYLLIRRASGSFVSESGSNLTVSQPQPSWIAGIQRNGVPTFYKGTAGAGAPPLMEQVFGVGEVPGFRGNAHMLCNKLAVTKYGNRIPNFEAVLDVKGTDTLDLAIKKLFDLAGLPNATYADVSALTGIDLHGYAVHGPQELGKVLQPLMLLFDLGARERDGKMVFFQRISPEIIAIDEGKFGAFDGEGEPPQALHVQNAAGEHIPGQVLLRHINKDNDYSPGEQRAAVSNSKDRPTLQVDIPVVVGQDDARTAAWRILAHLQGDNRVARTSFPPSYCHLEPGDLITATIEGHPHELEVLDLNEGLDGIIEANVLIRTARTHAWALAAE